MGVLVVYTTASLDQDESWFLEKGPLAQPVEQLTFNQLVERSNRSRPTIFIKGLASAKPFFGSGISIFS